MFRVESDFLRTATGVSDAVGLVGIVVGIGLICRRAGRGVVQADVLLVSVLDKRKRREQNLKSWILCLHVYTKIPVCCRHRRCFCRRQSWGLRQAGCRGTCPSSHHHR